MSSADNDRREALIYPLSVIVMLGWMGALGMALVKGEYTPLTVVTPVMLLLAGYVFGTSIVRSSRREDD